MVTEFLPQVSWSGKHYTISCSAGHHFREGRRIRDSKYLDDYAVFWFRKGDSPRSYSFWATDAVLHAGKGSIERGKDYNHSTYCAPIITSLVGLRPQADGTVVVNPLLPDDTWDCFCLDGLPYHGRTLNIFNDKTRERYGTGKDLHLLADGKKIVAREGLGCLEVKLTIL